MKKTNHYRKRASQRGISLEIEHLVDAIGTEYPAALNRTMRFIRKKDKNAIIANLKRQIRIIEKGVKASLKPLHG